VVLCVVERQVPDPEAVRFVDDGAFGPLEFNAGQDVEERVDTFVD